MRIDLFQVAIILDETQEESISGQVAIEFKYDVQEFFSEEELSDLFKKRMDETVNPMAREICEKILLRARGKI